jgi:hypothetical protein
MKLIRCYRSCADYSIREQIWQCSEYVHTMSTEPYAEFYIPEDRVFFALMIDPTMRHIASKDLIE